MLRMLALLTSVSHVAWADAGRFDYFQGQDIDYWREGRRSGLVPAPQGPTPDGQSDQDRLPPPSYAGATVVRAGEVSHVVP